MSAALTFTRMVLAEAMRLYPPAWLLARVAVENHEARGYVIHAGSFVVMSPWVVHRNASYFPEPEQFDPDRWGTVGHNGRPRFSYFPFGGGSRGCMGEAFAWMEGVLLLAVIAQRWRFRLLDESLHPEMHPALDAHAEIRDSREGGAAALSGFAPRGGERMREQTPLPFAQPPACVGRPQRRYLAIAEARAYAYARVVQGDVIAANQGQQRCAGEGGARSPRLERDEPCRLLGGEIQQVRQLTLAEVMQEQIRDRHIGGLGAGGTATRTHQTRRCRSSQPAALNPSRVATLTDGRRSTSIARMPV